MRVRKKWAMVGANAAVIYGDESGLIISRRDIFISYNMNEPAIMEEVLARFQMSSYGWSPIWSKIYIYIYI